MRGRFGLLSVAVGTGLLWAPPASGAESAPTAEQADFFEKRIRPVLSAHCYQCHSVQAKKRQGGLQLDSHARLLKGGGNGPALVPGRPDESRLIRAIRWQPGTAEMPPKGKLPDAAVADLVEWVAMGAPWPSEGATSPPTTNEAAASADRERLRREHWAFRPVRKPAPPAVRKTDWPAGPIDHFVLEGLEAAGLSPAAPADRRSLIRRASLDLTGLPPTPVEVDAFLADDAGDAFAKVVDRLLASPRYGERWGRHWLDVARYSDGFGGFLDNAALPHAWRYRDWVVDALNRDLPYNEFVKQQIAGDLMGLPGADAATGFFVVGPTYSSDGGDPDSTAQAKSETLDDRMDTLGRGLLGLTLSCARCHDHKFDPIPHQDYYSLAGVFFNTKSADRYSGPAAMVKRYQDHRAAIAALDTKLKRQRDSVRNGNAVLTAAQKDEAEGWRRELAKLNAAPPPEPPTTHALAEAGGGDMRVALRGDLRKPGEVAPRRFLRILAGEDPIRFTNGSGRLELAEAVVDPANPLTARVFVNRVWMHHFGRALVRTPSNFGALGEPPTHPALLDWLAARFVETGWSIKQLHRTIMLSAAYRMSTRFDAAAFRIDGDNRLLWRMNPRRLEVEAWRDSLLAATGELNGAVGGPPTEDVNGPRRTLYFKVSRNGDRFATDEFLRRFDFPLMRATVSERPAGVVPQQYLFVLNSPFMLARARALAARLDRETRTDEEWIARAHLLLYSRPVTAAEAKLASAFLALPPDPALPRRVQYAQVLLGSNEFLYVP